MPKYAETYTATRITFTSSLPVTTLLANLDAEIKRDINVKAGEIAQDLNVQKAVKAGDKAAFEEHVTTRLGDTGFMLFSIITHDPWFSMFDPKAKSRADTRVTRTYTIGNPLIARTMLQHDMIAGLYVPLRLVVQGQGSGEQELSRIVYDLPSSVIAADVGGVQERIELLKAAEALDAKLETMIRRVTGNDTDRSSL